MNSLADRVRGLLLVGFEGIEASRSTAQFLADAAGAILYSTNIADASQVRALVSGLQAARGSGKPPLLIATDQEGGTVRRIGPLGAAWPSAMALGAAADPELTHAVYRAIGAELAELGINLDFAPVADLNSNPSNPVIGLRSFGDDPAEVSEHVKAAVRGLHDAGIAATAKHFPGHGDTAVDSHTALPTVTLDSAQLRAREFVPFRGAIETGVDGVMTAHVALPAIEPDGIPATLSRAVLEGLLREELGYQGVICTDDMEMRAIADRCDPGEAAVRAVQAGADLILFHSFESAQPAERALASAVREGRLNPSRVETGLARIATLRTNVAARIYARSGSGAQCSGALLSAPSLSAQNATLAREAARRAITLVRSAGGMPPLRVEPGARVFIVNFSAVAERSPGERPSSSARVSSALGKAIAAAGFRASEQLRSLEPAGHEFKQLLMAAGSADAIVAVTRRAHMHPLQARAVADLASFGKPVVAVSVLEPYDARALPDNVAVIASFGDDEVALEAAADVLVGRTQPAGRMPVAASAASPA